MSRLLYQKHNIKNQEMIDFDVAMNLILEEHSLHTKDPITDFYETADVKNQKKINFDKDQW